MLTFGVTLSLIPGIFAPHGQTSARAIHGRVIAVSKTQVQLNDAIPTEILVLLAGANVGKGEVVLIRCSVQAGEFQKWFKDLGSLDSFLVQTPPKTDRTLNEFITVIEPTPDGQNVASHFNPWQAVNGYDLKSLPYGKPIRTYDSARWRHPIV